MPIADVNAARFDALANEWDSDPRRVFMAQKIARAMRHALAPSGNEIALELGAGTGLVTLIMARHVAHLTALDVSTGMLEVLRAKCAAKHLENVDTIAGSVPEAIPPARYDLIYASMLLHHISAVPALLGVLFGHVVPGGRVALADLDAEDGSFHGDAEGVAHHGFDRDVLAGWLRGAGFTAPQWSTAHTVQREGDDGSVRDYPIFLAVSQRPA
jgi:ubiquinone/menaquinone biosynthesis C-methylase UbiE